MAVSKAQKARESLALDRQQDLMNFKRDFQRVFSTDSGKRVIEFLEATIPRPLYGKTKEETVRNAAMYDFLAYIKAMIREPEGGPPPADAPSDHAREVRHGG